MVYRRGSYALKAAFVLAIASTREDNHLPFTPTSWIVAREYALEFPSQVARRPSAAHALVVKVQMSYVITTS